MQVFRLHSLPANITPNALYFIGDDGRGLCRAYVSGHTGNINEIKGVTNEADVIALASATIAATPSSDEKVAVVSGGAPGFLWGTDGTDGKIRMSTSMAWTKDDGNAFVTLAVGAVDCGTF